MGKQVECVLHVNSPNIFINTHPALCTHDVTSYTAQNVVRVWKKRSRVNVQQYRFTAFS